MWGNKQGWLISAIIAGLMGYMIWTFGQVPGIAKPSGQFVLNETIKLPIPPEEALPGVMTEDRDAGEQYWKAIEAYRADPKPYEKFEVTKAPTAAPKLEALNLIVQAAPARQARIFITKPETLVNYKYPWPELDALFHLGQMANSVGHYYVVSKTNANEAQAKKYLHAGFSLGAKLYEERLTHGEMMAGIKLMQGSADSLRELATRKKDKAREEQLKTFGEQTSAYYTTRVQKLYEKVVGAGRADVATYAGDVFELARNNPDRMWQVEAILKVGRYKYNATRHGDQAGAKHMLGDNPAKHGYEDWAQDPDPAVSAAGRAAKGLTIEQFRTIQ